MTDLHDEDTPHEQELDPPHHRFVLNHHTATTAEWACPACGRTIRLDVVERRFRVVRQGNALVNHGSASTSRALSFDPARVHRPDDPEVVH